MKHLLLTTITAVLLVGCGPSEADRALFKAAERGNIKAVKQQLAAGADVNAKDDGGVTTLQLAAHWGHKEIAELLIAEGADINAKDEDGHTPLHQAALDGHKEIAELLIAAGADVNAIGGGKVYPTKETPLDAAVRRKRTETADLLRKHGGKTGEELKATGN
jgi:ankyrin repeat protein